jgi:hypothetical protein
MKMREGAGILHLVGFPVCLGEMGCRRQLCQPEGLVPTT